MSADSTPNPISFLTAVFPSLSLEEFSRKAMLAGVVLMSPSSEEGGDGETTGRVVRGIAVWLPDSSRAVVTTVDERGVVSQSRHDLPRSVPELADLRRLLEPGFGAGVWLSIESGGRLVGLAAEVQTEPSRVGEPAAITWTQLVAATLPQVYGEAESFLRRKLESLAEFAAGAGHEINNPAATIVGRAGQLLRGEIDPERRRHLATIGAQAYRIRDMIGDAMLFARPPLPKLEPVTIERTLAEALDALQTKIAEKSIAIDRTAAAGTTVVQADSTQLVIVMCELLRNGIEASSVEGRIAVSIGVVDGAAGPMAEVRVTDWGKGLSGIEREHLFDPFFSGRQAGRGLGFGLSKSWRIVRQHGGTLTVDGEGASGTTFVVRLPMEPALPESAS